MNNRRYGIALPPDESRKGGGTMLVRAKWNVKDASGWHSAGEVFETEADLGDAVDVVEAQKTVKKAETPEPVPSEEPKPKTASRRKKTRE